MSRFTVTHTIDCSSEQYWQMFLDSSLCARMYLGPLGYTIYAPVRELENGTQISRVVILERPSPLPANGAKLLGAPLRYIEQGIYDGLAGFYSFRLIPATSPDAMQLYGVVLLEPSGQGRICRVLELTIESTSLEVDGLLEASLAQFFRRECDRSAAFFNSVMLRAAS